ncbi:exodeoxyribonuclease V subunit beta [Salinisphaera hydrothermalis]|uniref:RecBCD enzyme subunit RecB n=1 Tax=Salinisphaera hydrothermalis (strain C41B8) TaxID=1304275 RepID=A0A084IQU5_SALHC|nr:exodeoxyribonuclease V subunit beta [Salinisphaera hydrothermalis]KEZ79079.1 exodeoxyribonuclease V subunit beta [Salinisphaera hydrothermalis C41B8]
MNDSAHVSQPFDAATLPLSGLRLIEASAGTGKTFSLAGLYLRLIVEERASVRDVLVMTFTRAATQELRERIRARLADAARIAHAPELADPNNAEHAFTQQIIAGCDEPAEALARRLADAAARVDEATIVTIHGFAQRAATENAFESALAFDRGDAVDDPSLYREAAADYWREHVFGAEAAAGDVLALWPSPDALYQTIAPVLARPHARLAGIDHSRLATLQTKLGETWPGTAEPLATALGEAFEADALLKSGDLYKTLAAQADIPAMLADLDTRITAAIEADTPPALPEWLLALADPASQFKKAAKHQAYAEPLAAIEDALAVLIELQPLARLVAIDAAARAVAERAAARKIERRQYSYDDLIVALHAALTHERTGNALADALHARWPYALVDEFQDTDPLQYASLSRIYLEPPREHGALLLIGDPKQAIYGFRGGDIYAYLAAAHAAREARYTLTTNFRSTQHVLDAIEALYGMPGADPFIVSEIDFPHVDAGRSSGDRRLVMADGHERHALTFWQLHGNESELKNGKTKNPSKADDNGRLIDETIAAIGRLLDGHSAHWQMADDTTRPVAARDIAVLVNNHHEATTLQAALAARGIRAVCQHRDSVFASEEAADLRLILRAMAQPDDATAVRAAQPTALLGQRLADLIALADDDHAMQLAIERFHALYDAWRKRGVLSALEDLFVAAAPGLLALTDGERRMSNYLQLGELLANAEAECFGMASVVRWLDDRIAAAEDGALGAEDESQLRLESDADLVRISTVHASKGLQYPIVFLPFAQWLGTAGAPGKPPLIFHAQGENDTDSQAMIDLVGDDPANVTQAVVEARSEALRLLYVALTRAEQALIVGWREPDDYGVSGALGDLLYRNGVAGGGALDRLRQAAPDAIAIEPIDVAQLPPAVEAAEPMDAERLIAARADLPAGRPRWSTYSFSRLAHAPADSAPAELPEPGAEDELASQPADTLEAEAEGELPKLDDRLSGVRFGSAVHDLLEAQLKNPKHGPWPAPGEALAHAQRRQVYDILRKYGLIAEDETDPRIDDTADLVARTLHTPLPGIGPLAGLDHGQLLTEMEFMLRLGGHRLGALVETLRDAGYLPAALGGHPAQTLYGLMQGFIDLVVEVDGAYVILDYKTNRLGDTPAAYRDDALARAIGRAHYDLQYLIYTVALHRHLRRCLGEAYDPAVHLGGVQYLFVRAMDGKSDIGVFADRPPIELVEALDALFDGQSADRKISA